MPIKKDLTNQRFGKLVVIEDSGRRGANGGVIWKCQCDCGNIAYVAGNSLTRKKNGTISCGCKTRAEDITGQKFNHLLALEPTRNRSNGKIVWKCQCDCGNISYVSISNLRNGHTKTCGKCYNHLALVKRYPRRHIDTEQDIIGSVYGCYQVLSKSNQKSDSYNLYLCECIKCHSQTLKTIAQLKALKGDHCSNCHKENLIGKRYGKLLVIEEMPYNGQHTRWKCQCDCGNITIVQKGNLISGNTFSCGCIKRSKGELVIEDYLKTRQIPYEIEKKFNTCIFPNTQELARFDFYLPELNVLIEYDGQQHFQEVSIFETSLETVQAHDKFKNQWCKENNIPLIRIPYTQFLNIKSILDKELFNNNSLEEK